MLDPQTDPARLKTNPADPTGIAVWDPLLATSKLVKAYRHRRVVDGVSITVAPGEIVGLLGPNGAGKTTTFNMVVGVVRPDSGEVTFQQATITRLPMHTRARLGIVRRSISATGCLPSLACKVSRSSAIVPWT